MPLTLITNGLALPKFASELVEIGVDQLIVSIDGPAEVHNRVRNHPKSYQRATEGIRQVLFTRGACSAPFVQVSCTISTYTQGHLQDFVNTMGALGVDRIVFNNLIYATTEQVMAQTEVLQANFAVQCFGGGLDNSAFSGVDPALILSELSAIREGPWTERVFVAPPGVEQNLEAYYDSRALSFQDQFCTAIYRELWILPDGEVAACAHLKDMAMGNIRQAGLMAIWNGPRYRVFRQCLAKSLLPACMRCEKLIYEHPPK